jgi:hypothetical protein
VLVDRTRRHTVAVTPDLAHQRLTRDDVTTRFHQEREEVELHRAQIDRLTAAYYGARAQIDDDIRELVA